MEKTICLYKKRGQTPLEAIEEYRKTNPHYRNTTLSYAGRLDPMAEGLLLVLVDEENKKRTSYQDLSKTYEFSMLFGIATDTYDPLGLITQLSPGVLTQNEKQKIVKKIATYKEKFNQTYPPYSSFHIEGKPLFYYAKNNLLHTITIPSKKVSVSGFSILSAKTISLQTIVKEIFPVFEKISGDFRQEQIKRSWKQILQETPKTRFSLITCTLTGSSGTYIRSLVHDIGQSIEKGAIAYTIKRIRIGAFTLTDTENADMVR